MRRGGAAKSGGVQQAAGRRQVYSVANGNLLRPTVNVLVHTSNGAVFRPWSTLDLGSSRLWAGGPRPWTPDDRFRPDFELRIVSKLALQTALQPRTGWALGCLNIGIRRCHGPYSGTELGCLRSAAPFLVSAALLPRFWGELARRKPNLSPVAGRLGCFERMRSDLVAFMFGSASMVSHLRIFWVLLLGQGFEKAGL